MNACPRVSDSFLLFILKKRVLKSLSILRSIRVTGKKSSHKSTTPWLQVHVSLCVHVCFRQVKSLHQHHFTPENVVLSWLAKTRSDGEMLRDRKWSQRHREQRGAFVRTAFRSMTVIPHLKNILFFLLCLSKILRFCAVHYIFYLVIWLAHILNFVIYKVHLFWCIQLSEPWMTNMYLHK